MEKDTASIDPVTVIDDTSIKPFRVGFKQEAIDDLRRRIEMTRWASKELVPDASQGVQGEMLQELARYWATEYDLGRVAGRLNALPQFTTEIDGLRIHFIHVKSKHAERVAADHDARLARIGHRDARDHRAAHGSNRARWRCLGRVRPRAPIAAWASGSPASPPSSAGIPAERPARGRSS